jgi:hypothetical protein
MRVPRYAFRDKENVGLPRPVADLDYVDVPVNERKRRAVYIRYGGTFRGSVSIWQWRWGRHSCLPVTVADKNVCPTRLRHYLPRTWLGGRARGGYTAQE